MSLRRRKLKLSTVYLSELCALLWFHDDDIYTASSIRSCDHGYSSKGLAGPDERQGNEPKIEKSRSSRP